MAEAAQLELIDVDKRYDGVAVLRRLSLRVEPGESVAILGPSGSGKSTLLNLCGALDRPSAGVVRVAGRDLAGLDDRELAEVRRRQVGIVFQQHHLLPECTALENVLLPALAAGRVDDGALARARRLLDELGLGPRMEQRPGRLSGGERQRVAVARALLGAPRLLLADEPTGSLDRAAAAELGDLLLRLQREEGLALVVATHSEPLAARLGRTLAIVDGALAPVPR